MSADAPETEDDAEGAELPPFGDSLWMGSFASVLAWPRAAVAGIAGPLFVLLSVGTFTTLSRTIALLGLHSGLSARWPKGWAQLRPLGLAALLVVPVLAWHTRVDPVLMARLSGAGKEAQLALSFPADLHGVVASACWLALPELLLFSGLVTSFVFWITRSEAASVVAVLLLRGLLGWGQLGSVGALPGEALALAMTRASIGAALFLRGGLGPTSLFLVLAELRHLLR